MSLKFQAKQMGIYHTSTPVFNKRLYKAQAGIVLTDEIMKILNRTSSQERCKGDLYKLKFLVNGLKDIHKGFQYIKDALAIVLGYEKQEANVEVKKQPSEKGLSCFYILTGSIEATYDINDIDSEDDSGKYNYGFLPFSRQTKNTNSKNKQVNNNYIIHYTHVAGDYLGLVSGDGPEYDLPPPKNIKTLEPCEFLRIDRGKFHNAVRLVLNQYVREVEHFINYDSILRNLPQTEREKLVPLMAKQDYSAGKVIVNQGEIPDHIFFLGKGRCQFYRRVFIKEAHRIELVQLGQLEKGEVFGESSLLDGSSSFCSVTSVGQVTCFLINKWVIKHNDNMLRLLRSHQNVFYEDDIIQHYIRDSDVWQSYKRSQILELLDATNKQFISVNKKDIQDILRRSVEFGNAKRSQSSRASRVQEVGEPEPEDPLFVVPRSRRRSSAILQSNAAAVVKAVLLLRRRPDESNMRLPPIKPNIQRIKAVSAPSRYRSNKTMKNTNQSNQMSKTGSLDAYRSKSSCDVYRKEINGANTSCTPSKGYPCVQYHMTDISPNKRTSGNENPQKLFQIQAEKDEYFYSIKNPPRNEMDAEGLFQISTKLEKCISSNKNFIVKEIINTGIPNRKTSPFYYRRFDKSMFSILDGKEDEEESKRTLSPSPWGVPFAASKWLTGVRNRRRQRSAEDGITTPSPTPPPLIVIEEYAPTKAMAEELLDVDKTCDNVRTACVKPSRTPTPSLEQLDEENDDEINEYNKHEAGKALQEKWYTSIHEARDDSKHFLKQLNIEIEELKKSRRSIKSNRIHKECPEECQTKRFMETDIGQSKAVINAESLEKSRNVTSSSKIRKSARIIENHTCHRRIDPRRTLDVRPLTKSRHERRRLLLLEKIGCL